MRVHHTTVLPKLHTLFEKTKPGAIAFEADSGLEGNKSKTVKKGSKNDGAESSELTTSTKSLIDHFVRISDAMVPRPVAVEVEVKDDGMKWPDDKDVRQPPFVYDCFFSLFPPSRSGSLPFRL